MDKKAIIITSSIMGGIILIGGIWYTVDYFNKKSSLCPDGSQKDASGNCPTTPPNTPPSGNTNTGGSNTGGGSTYTSPPNNNTGTTGDSGGLDTQYQQPPTPIQAVAKNMNAAINPDGTVSTTFNSGANLATFYSNSRFVISRNPNSGYLIKGSYTDGGKTLVSDTGMNVGRKVTSGSVFQNIVNILK